MKWVGVCLLGMSFLGGVVSGQEKELDPFNAEDMKLLEAIEDAPETWELTGEVFSLPFQEAAALRRTYRDSGKIYAELLRRVGAKEAVLEEFAVLKTRIFSESEVASAEEYLFPTQYDPPEMPYSMANHDPEHDTSGLMSPSNPTAYDTRDLGLSMKADSMVKLSPTVISVGLELSRVALVGRDSWGKDKAEAFLPQFKVQGLKKTVVLKDGQPTLVGSMSPPWGGQKGRRRAWLVFAKATAVQLDEAEKKTGNDSDREVSMVDASWDATCEVFSMPLSEAAKLRRAGKSDRESYAELLKRLEIGKVYLEEFLTVRTRSADPTVLKEVREMIYATAYNPPELPNSVHDFSGRPEMAKWFITPASPTSFETKEVGTQMKVVLILGESGEIKLDSTLEVVHYLGRNTWGQKQSEAEMPRFTSQRLISQVETRLDHPMLLGSVSPPDPLQPKEGEQRVWLAFLTVSDSRE